MPSSWRRLGLLFAACVAASCGGGDNAAQMRVLDNMVITNDDAGVSLDGAFAPVDGYLSQSRKVMQGLPSRAAAASFALKMERSGFYELYGWWPQASATAGAAQVKVSHAGGESSVAIDQAHLGGQWNSLGIFKFAASGPARVVFRSDGGAALLVDALRVRYVGAERPVVELDTGELPIAMDSMPYAAQLQGRGGEAPYRFRISQGQLPPGFKLDEGGSITGVAGHPGSHTFEVQVTDAAGAQASANLQIHVVDSINTEPESVPRSAQLGAASERRRTSESPAEAGSLGNLPALVAAMPEGGWSKVNLNLYSDVWTPASLRPLFGLGNPTPAKIVAAWSSFTWDSNRSLLILYGGGHANYRGNDVYFWRASTRLWERAALPSEMIQDNLGNWNAIDGADHAPASAHTYDNALFFPLVDRMVMVGGAADANGGHYLRLNDSGTASRKTGLYLFSPALADPDKVGGSTGSHVQRVQPYPQILGGNMWSNRDMYVTSTTPPPTEAFVNGCSGYTQENGRDVAFFRTVSSVYKYTLHDLNDPARDTWQKVGTYWNGPESKATCAYDESRKILVRSASQKTPFVYWDMSAAGPNNRDVLVKPVDPSGEFETLLASNAVTPSNCGLELDPRRRNFKLWCGDGRVWALIPPDILSASGWTIVKQPAPSSEVPNGSVGTGILGKWKYVERLDVFIGLQDSVQGNIWIYKPVGWQGGGGGGVDPTNLPPAVALTQPAAGQSYAQGETITLQATASDGDGTVAKVEFFHGAAKIGEDKAAPYVLDWSNAPIGNAVLTAAATDNLGAKTSSATVSITVSGAGGGTATVVIQRGLNAFSQTADTYLSDYHKASEFGASTRLQDQSTNYSMLLRFAIFRSEGGPVPDGATIQSAKLSLYKYSSYNVRYEVYPSLRAWSENAANWTLATPGTAWATPGANGAGSDFGNVSDATAITDFAPGWMDFDMTTAVQRMSVDASSNHGWRLRAVSGLTTALKRFYSSDYVADPTLRPKLEIVYQ